LKRCGETVEAEPRRRLEMSVTSYRRALLKNRKLNAAIRRAVEYELMARALTFWARLPRVMATESRPHPQEVLCGLERLARRWRAQLIIGDDSWLRGSGEAGSCEQQGQHAVATGDL
jgi:hypothetical protein